MHISSHLILTLPSYVILPSFCRLRTLGLVIQVTCLGPLSRCGRAGDGTQVSWFLTYPSVIWLHCLSDSILCCPLPKLTSLQVTSPHPVPTLSSKLPCLRDPLPPFSQPNSHFSYKTRVKTCCFPQLVSPHCDLPKPKFLSTFEEEVRLIFVIWSLWKLSLL